MTEISFARSFLSALDGRPVKLSSDHTADPRKFTSGAIYTIAKYPSSPNKRKRSADTTSGTASTGQEGAVKVTLSYAKAPANGLELEGQGLGTSVFDVKNAYGKRWNVPVDKIKLLYAKKPVADSKTLKDVLPEGTTDAEFTVMLMGGVTPSDTPPAAAEEPAVPAAAQGPSGKDILATDQFWDDLKGFLVQRLKDENEGERLAKLFKEAAV